MILAAHASILEDRDLRLRHKSDVEADQVGLRKSHTQRLALNPSRSNRLPGRAEVRINKPGQEGVATREAFLGRWLDVNGQRAVEPLTITQPVVVAGHPVGYWHELPPQRPGTPRQLAKILHALRVPASTVESPPPSGFPTTTATGCVTSLWTSRLAGAIVYWDCPTS